MERIRLRQEHTPVSVLTLVVLTMIVTLCASCNREFPDLLKKNYPATGQSLGHAKILYIVMDGARGQVISSIAPPNLESMMPNSMYTFNSLADQDTEKMTNATAWANQMTGVDVSKSKVTSEDFAGNNLSRYPSFLSLLKTYNDSLKIAAFSSSSAFAANFTQAADTKQTFENDDASVASTTVSELQNQNADIVVAQFHEIETAGEATSFDATSKSYTNAIVQVDTYIGQIMNALKARPKFAGENWLVVVSSGKGGAVAGSPSSASSSAFDDPTRNTFNLFYSPKFTTEYIPLPSASTITYNDYGVLYTYANNNYVSAALSNTSAYNFGTSGAHTIQFMIKNTYTGGDGYPTVVSKRAADFTGEGWNIFLQGTSYVVNSSICGQAYGSIVSDGQWHVVTVVMDRESGVNTVKAYTDGKLNDTETATNTDVFNNTAPLRIGRIPTNGDANPTCLITNLQIYNTALPAAAIAALSCETSITNSHPYYSNLIGYWPGDEVGKNVLKERTGQGGPGTDFTLTGPYVWNNFNDYSAVLCPPIPADYYRSVPNSVDIPFQIMQWMAIVPNQTWQLDGRAFTPLYAAITP
jgi:hypothetical protein